MSLQAFRNAAESYVRLSVVGPNAISPQGNVASDYDDAENDLRAGQKGFALRVWLREIDRTDSNAPAQVAGVEVTVHRKILVPEDEALYTKDGEMFANQTALFDAAAWGALTGADGIFFDENPSIGEVPTRENNVITYTVELAVRLSI